MNVKHENDIAAPIEVDDTDDEDDRKNSAPQPSSDTNGHPIKSNETLQLSNVIENSNHKHTDIDLTIENVYELELKHETELKILHEIIDSPLVASDSNEKTRPIQAEPAIFNIPNQLTSVHKQPERKVFRCKDCTYSSRSKARFNQHRPKHATNKLFKCTKCDFVTLHKRSISRHTLIHDGNSIRRFKCDQCDYATHQSYHLNRHQRAMHISIK